MSSVHESLFWTLQCALEEYLLFIEAKRTSSYFHMYDPIVRVNPVLAFL